MGSVLSPRRRTDPMHNHDSPQLTGASPRGRSAACRRVPSHAVPCGTPYAPSLLGASLPAAERSALTATSTSTATTTRPHPTHDRDRDRDRDRGTDRVHR